MRAPTISKTSYVTGRQCPRWLWHRLRRPEAIPAADEATQRRFDLGHQVGDHAKRLFPDGVVGYLDPPAAGFLRSSGVDLDGMFGAQLGRVYQCRVVETLG
ncbi:MAG: hypothetical protein ACYDA8_03010 [Deferrisomatales bacterium]